MKKRFLSWICIGFLASTMVLTIPTRHAQAMFGEDIPFLIQLVTQAIQQIQALQNIIGQARKTASLLEEMNRGIKDVLRIAETAHIPLPKQIYDQAKTIDEALRKAHEVYGELPGRAPTHTRHDYRSGVEGLYLSEDAFEYSTFLDKEGNKVKSSALAASPSAAARLTAETLGVLLHAVSQTNRLQAKSLELQSTAKVEEAARDNVRHESFYETHDAIEKRLKDSGFSGLNSLFGDDNSSTDISPAKSSAPEVSP